MQAHRLNLTQETNMLQSRVRRTIIAGLAALAAASGPALAQGDFPNKPIRFILPYGAGGVTTNLMHLLGKKMTENWGQPVIVDNRPGANSAIGTEILAKSP